MIPGLLRRVAEVQPITSVETLYQTRTIGTDDLHAA
jgi:hypothetical protein